MLDIANNLGTHADSCGHCVDFALNIEITFGPNTLIIARDIEGEYGPNTELVLKYSSETLEETKKKFYSALKKCKNKKS